MERKNYTIAVDLGSSNVTVAVGEPTADGPLEVVCVARKPVEGVHAGRIENIELVGSAIREAVSEVEQQLGIRVTEAYAGISGDFVRCARHTDHVFVYDPQNGVDQKDVEALFERMRNVQAPDDETIMERVPQNYLVDDSQEVKNPVGSFGKKLSSTFNFILCLKTPLQRLDMALKRLGIRLLGVVPGALAAAEAVLLPDEKEEGAAVVDIGGGVTDVAVYYRNVVRYVATIPMGASAINRDIRTMSVPEKYVESLKQKYGSAVAELAPEDKLVRVNGRTAVDADQLVLGGQLGHRRAVFLLEALDVLLGNAHGADVAVDGRSAHRDRGHVADHVAVVDRHVGNPAADVDHRGALLLLVGQQHRLGRGQRAGHDAQQPDAQPFERHVEALQRGFEAEDEVECRGEFLAERTYGVFHFLAVVDQVVLRNALHDGLVVGGLHVAHALEQRLDVLLVDAVLRIVDEYVVRMAGAAHEVARNARIGLRDADAQLLLDLRHGLADGAADQFDILDSARMDSLDGFPGHAHHLERSIGGRLPDSHRDVR